MARRKRKVRHEQESAAAAASPGEPGATIAVQDGKADDDDDDDNGATRNGAASSKIYSLPALYDLAFGYRNFEREVEFLVHAHRTHARPGPDGDRDPVQVLELAAGPARHSLTALTDPSAPVTACHAVDLSSDMATYARSLAADTTTATAFAYSIMDMRNLDRRVLVPDDDSSEFDAAWMLLGSMQHLLTNDDARDALRSIGSVVRPGGTLVLELPHPRELFQLMECTRNGWEVPLAGPNNEEEGELRVVWGDEEDAFCPVTQQRQFTVELRLVRDDHVVQQVREVVPMRHYTAQEIDALAQGSGCWTVQKMYGALDEDTDVTDDDLAFRLVCVLQRV